MVKVEIDGVETEVFLEADVVAREAAARTAVEGELKPKLEQTEKDLQAAKIANAQRAGEFATFRKLSDDQVASLAEKDRIIYENQLQIAQRDEQLATAAKAAKETSVANAIAAKTGSNATLTQKVKDMYEVIQLDDSTPEGIAARVTAAIGALGTTQPDLLASAGFQFSGGAYVPNVDAKTDESFADTERGKQIANELGIMIEPPKQQ